MMKIKCITSCYVDKFYKAGQFYEMDKPLNEHFEGFTKTVEKPVRDINRMTGSELIKKGKELGLEFVEGTELSVMRTEINKKLG